MSSVSELDRIYACPRCGVEQWTSKLIESDYRCPECELETAHLDRAPNGSVRSVYKWLQNAGNVIHERYRIVGLLGRGGFAATYLVHDLRLDGKPWALKEVPEPMFDGYETNLLSRLDHPGIPAITDQFQEGELIYLVIKFGGNRTLESERKAHGGRIPVAVVVPWMKQLCKILDYLHSQNPPVIHRDLKPGNILLDEHNRIMLIDFGIAKQVAGDQQTRTLARAVTHGFSPPEQIGGAGTGPRSDIYSLAASFYALVTGITPPAAFKRFSGEPVIEPMNLIQDCPAQVNAAIMQALDLNLNNRQATISEFAMAFSADVEPRTRIQQNSGTVFVSTDDLNVVARKTPTAPRDSIPLPSTKGPISTRKTTIGATQRSYRKLLLILLSMVTISSIAALGTWFLGANDSVEPDTVLKSDPPEKPEMDQLIPTPEVESTPAADRSPAPVLGQPVQPVQSDRPVQSSTPAVMKRTEGPSPMEIFEQRRKMFLEQQNQQQAESGSRTKESQTQRQRPRTVVSVASKPTLNPTPKPRVPPQPKPQPQPQPKNNDWKDDLQIEWH